MPFPLDMGTSAIGFIFCGWGIALAISSVFIAPNLQARFGTLPMIALAVGLFAADLAVMALFAEAVVISAPVERATASAAYSFVRFAGGAAAPWLAGKLGETSISLPSWGGAACTAVGVVVLLAGRKALAHIDDYDPARTAWRKRKR